MKKADYAAKLLLNGYMCSCGVLKAYAQDFDLDEETACSISGGFAGGMAQGKICGAVSGAFMVIGLKYYRKSDSSSYSRDLCFQIVQEFSKRFTDKRNSLDCFDILKFNGINPYNSKEMGNLKERKLCDKVVRDAVEIMEEIFFEMDH